MRILMFSEPIYPVHPGGAGKCSHSIARGLVERGHRVHVVSAVEKRRGRHHQQVDGIEVHWLGTEGLVPPGVGDAEQERTVADELGKIVEGLRPRDFDLIHDSGGFLSYFFPLLHRLKRDHALPLVVQVHFHVLGHLRGCAPPGAIDPLRKPLQLSEISHQCFPIRLADCVISPSATEARALLHNYRPDPKRLVTLPNALGRAFFAPGDGGDWRSRLAPRGEKLILFGGRVDSWEKGADYVLRAGHHLLRRRRDLKLVLLTSDAKSRRRFAQRYGPDHVVAVDWIDSEERMASLYHAVDVVLQPSRVEVFGLMALEAMATGTPAVASATGALPDFIEHGRNGFLLRNPSERRWPEEMADSVLQILDHPKQARAMGRRAQASVQGLRQGPLLDRLESIYRALPRAPKREGLVTTPAFDRHDTQRLHELLPAVEPSTLGDHVDRWRRSVSTWCPRCTLKGLTQASSDLGQTHDPHQARRALGPACPLGVLQMAWLGKR